MKNPGTADWNCPQNVTIQPMYGCPVAEPEVGHLRTMSVLCRRELIEKLTEATTVEQIHDYGSIIGEVIAKYSKDAPDEIDDFVWSFSHGVSLETGTHDRHEENEFKYIKMRYHRQKIMKYIVSAYICATITMVIALINVLSKFF